MSKTKGLVFAFLLIFLFPTQVMAGVGHQVSFDDQLRLENQIRNLMQNFTGKNIFITVDLINGPFYAGKKIMPLGEALSIRSIIVSPSREYPNLYVGWSIGHTGWLPYVIVNKKKNKTYLSGVMYYGLKGIKSQKYHVHERTYPNVVNVFYRSKKDLDKFLPTIEKWTAKQVEIERKADGKNMIPSEYQVRIYNLNDWRACKVTDGHRFLHDCPHKTLFLRAEKSSPPLPPSLKKMANTVLKTFFVQAWALPGINTGPADSKKRMVIVFDANCPMCARQWKTLTPYLSQIRIHWVPVAMFSATSAKLGGALLAAHNPAAALAYNEEHYNFKTDTGGYLAPEHLPARYVKEVRQNTASPVIQKNVLGTPAVGLELVPGKKYFFVPGMITAQRMAKVLPLLGQ